VVAWAALSVWVLLLLVCGCVCCCLGCACAAGGALARVGGQALLLALVFVGFRLSVSALRRVQTAISTRTELVSLLVCLLFSPETVSRANKTTKEVCCQHGVFLLGVS
jgi:hypothetical protein